MFVGRIFMLPLLAGSLFTILRDPPSPVSPTHFCETYFITGYVRTEFSSYTYDGTPIMTHEPIVAASWNLPINTVITVDGLGTFRVADRGHLSPRHIDVPVWTRAEAYKLTGYRKVCVPV